MAPSAKARSSTVPSATVPGARKATPTRRARPRPPGSDSGSGGGFSKTFETDHATLVLISFFVLCRTPIIEKSFVALYVVYFVEFIS